MLRNEQLISSEGVQLLSAEVAQGIPLARLCGQIEAAQVQLDAAHKLVLLKGVVIPHRSFQLSQFHYLHSHSVLELKYLQAVSEFDKTHHPSSTLFNNIIIIRAITFFNIYCI